MKVQRDGNLVTIDGETKTLVTWCKHFGIGEGTVRYRIKNGWDDDELFMKPTGKGRLRQTGEAKKRGCHWCADFKRKCQHEVCPYHELDDVKTYDEYLKKAKKNGFVKLLESLG